MKQKLHTNILTMKIKILFVIIFLCGIANAQEKIVPRPWTYCWPLSIAIYDTAFHYQKEAYRNNKVKFFIEYDESGKQLGQSFINKDGLVYLTLENDSTGRIKTEYQTTYDSYGQVILTNRIEYDQESYPYLPDKKIYTSKTNIENINGFPWKKYLNNDEDTSYAEAVYENEVLKGVRLVREGKKESPFLCEIGHVGDTTTMCGTDWDMRLMMLVTKQDTAIMSGIDMWPTYTIVKNHRLVYTGDKSSYTKYFYKSNGLKEYVLIKENNSKPEEKHYFKYTYYED